MSGFLGTKTVLIQPKTQDVIYRFNISVKASSTATEGFLAYDTTVSGVSVLAYKTSDENNRELVGGEIEVDDLIQGTPTVSDNNIDVQMSYPSTNGYGYYSLEFELTISDGSVEETEFDRVVVKNR